MSGREVRTRTLDVEVDHADVLQLGGARDERVEQDRRRRGRAMEVDLLPGPDAGDGLGGGDDLHGGQSRRRELRLNRLPERGHAARSLARRVPADSDHVRRRFRTPEHRPATRRPQTMPRHLTRLAAMAATVAILVGCVTAPSGGWTYASPPAATAVAALPSSQPAASAPITPTGKAIEIEAFDLGFTPGAGRRPGGRAPTT